MTYENIKKNLLRWHKKRKHRRRKKTKARFIKASRELGKPGRFFAPRLRNLYSLAYPHKNPEHSNTLRKDFQSFIPKGFRRQIKSAESFHRLAGKGKMKWTQIFSLISNLEEEQTMDDSVTEYETDVQSYTAAHELPVMHPNMGILVNEKEMRRPPPNFPLPGLTACPRGDRPNGYTGSRTMHSTN